MKLGETGIEAQRIYAMYAGQSGASIVSIEPNAIAEPKAPRPKASAQVTPFGRVAFRFKWLCIGGGAVLLVFIGRAWGMNYNKQAITNAEVEVRSLQVEAQVKQTKIDAAVKCVEDLKK